MKPKNFPRLWCALQGLLPLESCLAAQRGELAWPNPPADTEPGERDGSVSRQMTRVKPRRLDGSDVGPRNGGTT